MFVKVKRDASEARAIQVPEEVIGTFTFEIEFAVSVSNPHTAIFS